MFIYVKGVKGIQSQTHRAKLVHFQVLEDGLGSPLLPDWK